MNRQVSIRVKPLPHRARPLDEREVSGVFGGCGAAGDSCKFSSECCLGLVCDTIPAYERFSAYLGCRTQ